MSKPRCHITISLDGFVAGPDQSEENPLGEGGERLHDWRVPLEQAKKAAGGKDVMLWGGGNVAQQYLAAGLPDELELHVVPVLLGGGGSPPTRRAPGCEVAHVVSQPGGAWRLEGMTNSEQASVLITGGNKGLGFEAARRLGELGWTIFLGSRDVGRGRAAADKLTDGGAKVVMVPLDVTSDESVTGAVRLVREHTDRLDVLINNAGATGRGVAPADATVDEIHSVYDTNVYGPIRVTHAFLPLLRAADHPRVVMVSSAVGAFSVVTDPEQPSSKIHELAYSSSKAALNMITVRYAQALPEIKFNVTTPGEVANHKFAATDMNHHTGELTATEGTDSIMRLAIDAGGPTGTFTDRLGPIAW